MEMKREIKVGDHVYYHPVIGREHDGKLYTIKEVGELSGVPVAWLTDKRGCVAIRALSPAGPLV